MNTVPTPDPLLDEVTAASQPVELPPMPKEIKTEQDVDAAMAHMLALVVSRPDKSSGLDTAGYKRNAGRAIETTRQAVVTVLRLAV